MSYGISQALKKLHEDYPSPFLRRDMTGPAMQAGTESNLIDGVTQNVEVQIDNLNGLTQVIRAFCDGIMGSTLPPPSPANSAQVPPPPDTRGSKLVKSTERLAVAVRELGDQTMRLKRI